ncbi:MAG: caspase family protein [Deltaproteobacteria bacterium]|nr:caspase family protein [Deltaproteobacteria bacterium]
MAEKARSLLQRPLIVALPLVWTVAGCLDIMPPIPPQRPSTPSVHVEAATVEFDDDKCQPLQQEVVRRARRDILSGFASSGWSVIAAKADPHDLNARVHAHVLGCGSFGAAGNLLVQLERDGRTVGSTQVRMDQAFRPEIAFRSILEPEVPIPAQPPTTPHEPAVAAVATKPATSPPLAAEEHNAPDWMIGAPQPAMWAIVIGIETYRDLPAARGARADAESFAEMARVAMGIPEDHIRTLLDTRATHADLDKAFAWLAASVPPGGRALLYYGGHGTPQVPTGTSYLLPYDGDPRDLQHTGLDLGALLKSMSQNPNREVIAVVDSCFSGAGPRSVLPEGTRPLVRVKEVERLARVALFTASASDQIAGSAPGIQGGVFSWFVTDGLGRGRADINGDGRVTLQELVDWVRPRVARESRRDARQQEPQVVLGPGIGSASEIVLARSEPAR